LVFGDVLDVKNKCVEVLGNYSKLFIFRTNAALTAKSTLLRIKKLREDNQA